MAFGELILNNKIKDDIDVQSGKSVSCPKRTDANINNFPTGIFQNLAEDKDISK